jgi:hypothetical protein
MQNSNFVVKCVCSECSNLAGDDEGQSGRVTKENVKVWLFENDWFRGRLAFFQGINGLIPLAPLFFDRTASSDIVA